MTDSDDSVARPQSPGRDPKPNREEWREEKDLEAQQQMAAWAGLMFLITAAGVWYVARTLDATRAAVSEAEKATAAATKTADITRDIGEAQVRAYFSAPSGSYSIREVENEFAVRIILKNVGQSPARDIIVRARLEITDYFIPAADFKQLSSFEARFHGLAVGEEHEISFWWEKIAQPTLDSLKRNDATTSVKLFATYWDVFDKQRHENFAKVARQGSDWLGGNLEPT